MTTRLEFAFTFQAEVVAKAPAMPFSVVVTGDGLGSFHASSGAIPTSHLVASSLNLDPDDEVIFFVDTAEAANVQAGITRSGLVMTEPASGTVQQWILGPREEIDIDDLGASFVGIGAPECVIPGGVGALAIISAPVPSVAQSFQIDATAAATLTAVAFRAGTVRVHFDDVEA